MFEATVDIEPGMIMSSCRSVESKPQLACEFFCYECWLGYPLLTSSTVAPEPLLEHLRSSRGSFDGRVSMGVTRANPAWVAPVPWRSLGLF